MKRLKLILIAILLVTTFCLIIASVYLYRKNGDVQTIVTCCIMTMVMISACLPLIPDGTDKKES